MTRPGWRTWTVDELEQEAIENQRRRVLATLAQGPLPMTGLMETTGLTRYEVRRALRVLRDRQLVTPPVGEARRGRPNPDDGPQIYTIRDGP